MEVEEATSVNLCRDELYDNQYQVLWSFESADTTRSIIHVKVFISLRV